MNKIQLKSATAFFSIAVVVLHIVFIAFCVFEVRNRITENDVFFSTLMVFLPVFGVYVAIVVRNIKVQQEPESIDPQDKTLLDPVTGVIMVLLLGAYVVGNLYVMLNFGGTGLITQQSLPGAIAFVETAFGSSFSFLFVQLFEQQEATKHHAIGKKEAEKAAATQQKETAQIENSGES